MRDYYAARAQEYDTIYKTPERQADLRLVENWISGIFAGRRILEVACGTGYWTQFFAPSAARVVATDATEETLAIARQRKGTEKVDFQIANAYALPDSLGSFNAIFAGFWLSHVPLQNMRSFLEGLHKRAEQDALIVFLDNLYVEGSSTPISEKDDYGNTYQIRTLNNGTSHRVLKNFPSQDDLIRMIDGMSMNPDYRAFDYYWGFCYNVSR